MHTLSLNTAYATPLNDQTQYTYNKSKQLTKVIKPSGKSIEYIYNNSRLQSIKGDSSEISYNYKFASTVSKISRDNESIEYNYDGTLLTKVINSGTLNANIDYTYNNNLQINKIAYANKEFNIELNKDNQAIKVGDYTKNRDTQSGVVTSEQTKVSQKR